MKDLKAKIQSILGPHCALMLTTGELMHLSEGLVMDSVRNCLTWARGTSLWWSTCLVGGPEFQPQHKNICLYNKSLGIVILCYQKS